MARGISKTKAGNILAEYVAEYLNNADDFTDALVGLCGVKGRGYYPPASDLLRIGHSLKVAGAGEMAETVGERVLRLAESLMSNGA